MENRAPRCVRWEIKQTGNRDFRKLQNHINLSIQKQKKRLSNHLLVNLKLVTKSLRCARLRIQNMKSTDSNENNEISAINA